MSLNWRAWLAFGHDVLACAAAWLCAYWLRFTPELHFQPDVSYDEARHIDELLASPDVARDLHHEDED